jgi:hypothetical protein
MSAHAYAPAATYRSTHHAGRHKPLLPPTPRDLEIYRQNHLEKLSTRQLAEKFDLSQTRIRQILQRVNQWLIAVLPPCSGDQRARQTYLAQCLVADQLHRQIENLENLWIGTKDLRYLRAQAQLLGMIARLGVLPGMLEGILADGMLGEGVAVVDHREDDGDDELDDQTVGVEEQWTGSSWQEPDAQGQEPQTQWQPQDQWQPSGAQRQEPVGQGHEPAGGNPQSQPPAAPCSAPAAEPAIAPNPTAPSPEAVGDATPCAKKRYNPKSPLQPAVFSDPNAPPTPHDLPLLIREPAKSPSTGGLPPVAGFPPAW